MGFNRKDLEDDDFSFDDDFNFDDDAEKGTGQRGDRGAAEPDFGFEDEGTPDLEGKEGFGFEEEDIPEFDEGEEREGGGLNRTFIILAALMIALFVIGLVVVLVLATQPQPLSEFAQTSTAIAIINATTIADANQTATESAILIGTQTAEALIPPTETPTPRPPTNTPTPSFTAPPTVDATSQFATLQAAGTAQILALTRVAAEVGSFVTPQVAQLTQIASVNTPVLDPNQSALATQIAILVQRSVPTQQPGELPPPVLDPNQETQLTAVATIIQGIDPTVIAQANLTAVAQVPPTQGITVADVQLTATALALALQPPATTIGGVPTQERLTPIPGVPTALPETGFLDEAASSGGIGAIALMALALVVVIIVSRRLRAANPGQ